MIVVHLPFAYWTVFFCHIDCYCF